ncbi:hypothetical protein B0H14DRAFT_2838297 [Mycena olivaceomarginata]|nr:hypothetical protein B0H14DRAFT_2838297 [Mycena olivaceomarginata]
MLALAVIPVFLSTVLAAATKRSSRCDLSGARIEVPWNQTQLVAPSEGPSFIGVAIGFQNYTNVGAGSGAFDVSCLYDKAEFDSVQQIAYDAWKFSLPIVPFSEVIEKVETFHESPLLGQHFFIPSPSGTGISPVWNFASAALAGHADAFVLAAKVGDVPAPTGPPDVFRVATVGGLPPSSCKPGTPQISVKYASTYWLFGSSVQQ